MRKIGDYEIRIMGEIDTDRRRIYVTDSKRNVMIYKSFPSRYSFTQRFGFEKGVSIENKEADEIIIDLIKQLEGFTGGFDEHGRHR